MDDDDIEFAKRRAESLMKMARQYTGGDPIKLIAFFSIVASCLVALPKVLEGEIFFAVKAAKEGQDKLAQEISKGIPDNILEFVRMLKLSENRKQ